MFMLPGHIEILDTQPDTPVSARQRQGSDGSHSPGRAAQYRQGRMVSRHWAAKADEYRSSCNAERVVGRYHLPGILKMSPAIIMPTQ